MLRHHRELADLIGRKLPGAVCSWEQRKKHMRLVVTRGDQKAVISLAITPSDSKRCLDNALMCVRKAFRQKEAAQAG